MAGLECICAVISIMGLWLNVKKDVRGYWLWLAANILWGVYAVGTGQWWMAVQYSAFFAVTVYGIRKWGKA